VTGSLLGVATPRLSGPPIAAPPDPETSPGALRRMRRNSRELVQARELTVNLVRRELKAEHRGTFLGRVWSLANPLLLVGLYYVIFTYIVGRPLVDDLPRPDGHKVPFAVYFFAGLVIWNVFGTSAGNATNSVVGSGYLLRKVYFPRAILPLSSVLSAMVTFGFELAVLFVIALLFVGLPSAQLLWVPVILLVVGVLAYGAALLLSAVTVFLRDVAHFIGVFLQLWFWGTPIVYSLQWVANKDNEWFIRILEANPMTGIVVSFRNVVVLNRPPNFALLGYDLAFGVVLLAVGWWVFQRWQRLFAEIV
jgi:lipopolysaccharide transport system permease protein